MIYCSVEPGLFILSGLAPYETEKAMIVIKSLMMHKNMMDQDHVQIPMTKNYLEYIYSALDKIQITTPPFKSVLKNYIIAILAKTGTPLLAPSGLNGITLNPDITSDWIDGETKLFWLDSLTAAIIEACNNNEILLIIATWYRQAITDVTRITHPNLFQYLELDIHECEIPIVSDELDWKNFFCVWHGWPEGLDSTLIDCYAKRHLGILPEQLVERREIQFAPACERDIFREGDATTRKSIIEVIACRAFNRLKPEHNDETVSGQPGVRRVYIKKMAPPIRLHYKMDDEKITYILYSNGDHNRGL